MAKGLIGIFSPDIQNTERYEFTDALCSQALRHDCRTIFFTSISETSRGDTPRYAERSVFPLAAGVHFDAIVLFAELFKDEHVNEAVIEYAQRCHAPVFTVDRQYDGAFYIGFDEADPFGEMALHVIEKHGAKKLCMINSDGSREKEQAFIRVLAENSLKVDKKSVYNVIEGEDVSAAVERMLSEHKDSLPDAVICSDDLCAACVIRILEEKGRRVPEDIIVTGFDGNSSAVEFFPTITTAKRDCESACRYIMGVVSSALAGEEPVPEKHVFDFCISEGQSCGCIRKTARSAQLINYRLSDMLVGRQNYRREMDLMTLECIDDLGLENILSQMEQNVCGVLSAGIEIYLDPSFFGFPKGLKCQKIMAARVDPKTLGYSLPFIEVPVSKLCSEELIDAVGNVLIIALHCRDKVYGYLAAQFSCSDIRGADRLSEFVTKLNVLLSNVENVAKLSEMVEALNDMYIRDALTNMLNRRGFYREIDELILKAKQHRENLMIISVDLDGLKYINDTFGHAEGDFAIISAADILQNASGQTAVCARFGGDEFLAAVISDEPPAEYEKRFYALQKTVNENIQKPYQVNASVGIEIIKPEDEPGILAEAIKKADDKMFRRKKMSKFFRGSKPINKSMI